MNFKCSELFPNGEHGFAYRIVKCNGDLSTRTGRSSERLVHRCENIFHFKCILNFIVR